MKPCCCFNSSRSGILSSALPSTKASSSASSRTLKGCDARTRLPQVNISSIRAAPLNVAHLIIRDSPEVRECKCADRRSSGRRLVFLPQRSLHEDTIDPAAVLYADRAKRPSHREAAACVQFARSLVGAVADYGDHPAKAAQFALVQQGIEQHAPDAQAEETGVYIDGVLDGESISTPFPIRTGIGVSDQPVVEKRRQIGEAVRPQLGAAAAHLLERRRLGLERGEAMAHVMRVDTRNGWDVLVARGNDNNAGYKPVR